MKRLLGLLLVLSILSGACTKEEFITTGSLRVTTFGNSTINGTPINEMTIGIFDISALLTQRYPVNEAIEVQRFREREALFENINYGTYVIVPIVTSNIPPVRKTVQIRAGQLTTVNLFG